MDFCLACADRLHYYYVHSCGVENPDRVYRGTRKTSDIASGSHAANVDFSFETMVHHTYSVAQDCASREGAGGVYGQYAYLSTSLAELFDGLVDERALAGSCGTCNPNSEGSSCTRIELVN